VSDRKTDLAAPTPQVRLKFERLTREWKSQNEFLSSPTAAALLPAYQKIIGMGPEIVPLILEELEREPDQWFWALNAITDADPVPPEHLGAVDLMAEDWLRWGREQGLGSSA
jgi:hypothetical protein